MTENESEHSKLFSPSGYSKDLACPARVIHNMTIADDDGNPRSRLGTYLHDVRDSVLKLRIQSNLTESRMKSAVKGYLLPVKSGCEGMCKEAGVDPDDCVQWVLSAVDWVLGVRSKILGQVAGKFTDFFEVRLNDSPDSFGTVDYGMVLIGKQAHILVEDFKSGAMAVDVEENKQAFRYARMLIQNHVPEGVEIGSLHFMISQPTVYDKPQVWKCPKEVYDKFEKEFVAHQKHVYQMLKEGPKEEDYKVSDACTFCKGIGTCPLMLKSNEHIIEAPMTEVAKFNPEQVPVERIPLETRERIHEAAPMIKKFLAAVSSSVQMDLLKNPSASETYGVFTNYGKRSWTKEFSVSEVAKELRAQGLSSVTKSALVGIGALEKQAKTKGLDVDLSALTCKPDPSPILAKRAGCKKDPWVPESVDTTSHIIKN